jgi:type I pantothenate kinase
LAHFDAQFRGDHVNDLSPLVELVAEAAAGSRRSDGPFVVGIAGGVAAGKTFAAEALAVALAERHGLSVAVVGSDGFLLSNAALDRAQLAARKGFPESFDVEAMRNFLISVRAGATRVEAPRYDHVAYDVLVGDPIVVEAPNVLVFEGVNVLQPEVVDLVDLAIFLEAGEDDLRAWFHERIRRLRAETPGDGTGFYDAYRSMSDDEFAVLADLVWDAVNLPNLRDHIAPTRERADVVVRKSGDHSVVDITSGRAT